MQNKSEVEFRLVEFIANLLSRDVTFTNSGPAVLMSPLEAIEFSCSTGSGFLVNPNFPFSLRPFTKVFSQTLSLEVTSGIFKGDKATYSPLNILNSYPFLKTSEKKLIVLGCESEEDYRRRVSEIFQNETSPSDVIVLKVELWKRGLGLESLLEFSALYGLKLKGLFGENQVPLGLSGTPDLVSFFSLSLREYLSANYGVRGAVSAYEALFWSVDPSALRNRDSSNLVTDFSLVGEAKVDATTARAQRQKYILTGYFDLDYLLTSRQISNKDLSNDRVLSTIMFQTVPSFDVVVDSSFIPPKRDVFLDWMSLVIKVNFALGNLSDNKNRAILNKNDLDYFLSIANSS